MIGDEITHWGPYNEPVEYWGMGLSRTYSPYPDGMFWNDLWGPKRSYVCGSGSFLNIFQSSSSEGMKLTPMKKGILEVVIITQVNDVGMSFFSWKTSCG